MDVCEVVKSNPIKKQLLQSQTEWEMVVKSEN